MKIKSKHYKAKNSLPFELPKKCFVSHAYQDKSAINSLKKNVPPDVELIIFPREEPDTRNPVSNNIIPIILSCDGLIYLEGGYSASSAWVVFERDYGLRTGKAVFSYDPKTKEFTPDHDKPIKLQVQVFASEQSKKRANKLIKWMRQVRKFKLSNVETVHNMGDVSLALEEMANAKKLILWLVDDYTDAYVKFENDYISDPHELEFLDIEDGWWPPPRIFAKIDPDWKPYSDPDPEVYAVALGMGYVLPDVFDLFEDSNSNDFNWNRVDDLIITITLQLKEPNPNPVKVHDGW